ncbi:hypothetical protein N7468_006171 [Penicillium chermesinum]|uniref:Uncharacterized protein n=1 Tax=Penicillium chermesinum TaxID=63820 RepID=A0A9W9TJD1_9EURO|nr:uncharacterized protein N7468_006171 [Penicillium chermesinum]KAJ5224946.1 hypothetical protein N7468_006171 [Penicillium chermesinum]
MTSDKQNNGHLAKPFTPTLSAAFHRSNKTPLTPKLASPSPHLSSARRAPQNDPPTLYSTPCKDEPLAATPTFLSANVTPRSGPRNTRRDLASSSPTNTPPAAPSQAAYPQPTIGLGLSAPRRTERSPARSVKADRPRSLRAKTLTVDAARPNSFNDLAANSPRFFHASDTRFVYANGDEEQQSSANESSVLGTSKRRSGGLSRPSPAPRPSPSPSPRLKSPRVSDAATSSIDDAQFQFSPNPEQYLDNALQRLGAPPNVISERPQAPYLAKHRKSSSVDSNNQNNNSNEGLRASPVIIPPSTFPETSAPVMGDQIPNLRPRVFSNGSSVSADPYNGMPLSPGKSEGGDVALNNARTERKILDLEISNSSLLAINRTLEREMRKQTAELRRFKRLSRSGRLSMAPSARSFSGAALSTTSEMDEGTSELSSMQDDFSDFSDEDSAGEDGVRSPDSQAEHDAKHRALDEKRFMLDLSRHQELLVDSQKMNQSLKRCLGWTEELIREGQRALEYNVHVQDVELGGRVLSPEEVGEIGESGRALLSPSTEFDNIFFSSSGWPVDDPLDPSTFPLPSSPGGTD